MNEHYQKRIDENYREAKALYLKGMSMTEIEQKLGFSRKRLSSLLKYEDIFVRQNGQKYQYNDTVFETIDTEDKAYWLGFLYADGNIRVIGQKALTISLCSKDEHHLKKFADFISPGHRISQERVWLEVTQKAYNSVRLSITNSKIVDDLIAKGCYPEKTFTLKYPGLLPKDMNRHFIRGYFDGDGTAAKVNGKPCFGIMGASADIIYDIESILHDEAKVSKRNIARRQRESRKDLYEFKYGAKADVISLYHYLYDNSSIFLERKNTLLKERIYGPSCGNV